MIDLPVIVPIRKHQISGFGSIVLRSLKKPKLGQFIRPTGSFAVIRDHFTRNSGIRQAETDKQGGPFSIWLSVPGAVAAPAIQIIRILFFIIHSLEIPAALLITHLGLCDGKQILRPVPA